MGTAIATAIVGVVGSLTTLGVQWVLRRWKQQDTPGQQAVDAAAANRKAIAKGEAGDLLTDRLDRTAPNGGGMTKHE